MAAKFKFAEKLALAEWMKRNRQWLLNERPTRDEAADKAMGDLNGKIRHRPSGPVLRSVAKDAGIQWVPRNSHGDRVNIAAAFKVLLAAHVRLCGELGAHVTPEVEALNELVNGEPVEGDK